MKMVHTHLAHAYRRDYEGFSGYFPSLFSDCIRKCVCMCETAAMRLHQNDVIKINGKVCVVVFVYKFVCTILSSPPPSPPMILIKIVICTIKHFMLIASALMDTVVHAVIYAFMLPRNAWFFEKGSSNKQNKI